MSPCVLDFLYKNSDCGILTSHSVGASYLVGGFTMSTWIPFVWGWVNVLVLVVSSFRIQGGL